jgi:hypothetical protein
MTVMLSEWSQFAERHWIVGGILASLLWFFAGKQSLSKGRAATAVFWQSVAVIIILLLCLSGHPKTGQRGSGQNRPTEEAGD